MTGYSVIFFVYGIDDTMPDRYSGSIEKADMRDPSG